VARSEETGKQKGDEIAIVLSGSLQVSAPTLSGPGADPRQVATLLLNPRHRILKGFVSKASCPDTSLPMATGWGAFAGMLQCARGAVVARDRHARNYSVPARSCDVMLEEVVGLGAERERRCSHTCQGESPAVISFRSVD
jgi:hypothetical protein